MSVPLSWCVVSDVLDVLALGVSAKGVSGLLGVSRSSVRGFAKLAGMTFVPGSHGGVDAPLARERFRSSGASRLAQRPRRYSRLSSRQRVMIQTLRELDEPLSVRAIARRVGVSASTVSRELRRGTVVHAGTAYYHASVAHYRAVKNRHRYTPSKLDNPALRHGVRERLNQRFSPQQVAGELALMFPNTPEMNVSHETIYQALYVQTKGGLRHELTVHKALRSGRQGRRPQSKLPRRTNRPWLHGAMLKDQPQDKFSREVPGNWEGDLVVGDENSGLVTLVERHSRYTLIGRLPSARDSQTVIDVLKTMIRSLPEALMKTITWDQGPEMAYHSKFTVETGCEVFFCDPHSPWQRPSNENTNGLIRDFYPKGTNFNTISNEDIAHMQHLINIRPRRMHEYRNAATIMEELIQNVALAS